MLKEERYDKILEILEDEQYISAANLSKKLYVSLPTIRRDLAELQRRNQITKQNVSRKNSVDSFGWYIMKKNKKETKKVYTHCKFCVKILWNNNKYSHIL